MPLRRDRAPSQASADRPAFETDLAVGRTREVGRRTRDLPRRAHTGLTYGAEWTLIVQGMHQAATAAVGAAQTAAHAVDATIATNNAQDAQTRAEAHERQAVQWRLHAQEHAAAAKKLADAAKTQANAAKTAAARAKAARVAAQAAEASAWAVLFTLLTRASYTCQLTKRLP